jgi:hypothetical protein
VGESLIDSDKSSLDEAMNSDDEIERTRRRAYRLWERDGRPEGAADRYWYQAEQDIREPVTAQALAARTGLNIDEAQDLIERLGADWELLEQAAASRGA